MPDRLQQGRFLRQACHFKYARRIIENRIDAGQLVEKGDEKGEQNRDAQPPGPERRGDGVPRGSGDNRIRLGFNLGWRSFRLDQPQHSQTLLAVPFPRQQPARTLRQAETEQGIDQRRNRRHPQHPAPGIFPDPAQQPVGHISDEDAEDDVELKHARQASPIFGRGNFRDVKRRRHCGDADAQSPDGPRQAEGSQIRRQSGPDGTDQIENANGQQGRLASEPVRGPATQQGAHHRAVEGRADRRQTVRVGGEVPKRLDGFFRPGYDDRVKSEEKPGQRRRDRPEQDPTIHAADI